MDYIILYKNKKNTFYYEKSEKNIKEIVDFLTIFGYSGYKENKIM